MAIWLPPCMYLEWLMNFQLGLCLSFTKGNLTIICFLYLMIGIFWQGDLDKSFKILHLKPKYITCFVPPISVVWAPSPKTLIAWSLCLMAGPSGLVPLNKGIRISVIPLFKIRCSLVDKSWVVGGWPMLLLLYCGSQSELWVLSCVGCSFNGPNLNVYLSGWGLKVSAHCLHLKICKPHVPRAGKMLWSAIPDFNLIQVSGWWGGEESCQRR